MKLSEELRDAIDGGEERRGRDSQLTEWITRAEALEGEIERLKGARALTDGRGNDISHLVEKPKAANVP